MVNLIKLQDILRKIKNNALNAVVVLHIEFGVSVTNVYYE